MPQVYVNDKNNKIYKPISNISAQPNNDYVAKYIDILFRSIRELQSEIAMLKNTFEFGIESYTEKNTAMSCINGKLNSVKEEPLWSVMESGLSEIDEISIGESNTFESYDRGKISVITNNENYHDYLRFENSVIWKSEKYKKIVNATDSKLFCYLTVTSSFDGMTIPMDIIVKYDVYDTNNNNFIGNEKTIDLSSLNLNRRNSFNILLVISRKTKKNKTDEYGHNFIWLSISDAITNEVITEGYWGFDGDLGLQKRPTEETYGYVFKDIIFRDLDLTKFNIYSKYQDFSHEVIPSKPSISDYKFKTAHISIRSVKLQKTLLEVQEQIMNNELIFVEETGKLWIKSNNKLTPIAGSEGGGEIEEGMTKEEMLQTLKEMGIVYYEKDNNIKINNLTLDDVTFIHHETGNKFNFKIDSEGNLVSKPIADKDTEFQVKLGNNENNLGEKEIRGFIGTYNLLVNTESPDRLKDTRLNSDRLKIGSFYAPFKSDIVHGCSHSYIELENTSDKDYNLKGCYLHYTLPVKGEQVTYHLPLNGVIHAGGTYLIRGKKHAEYEDPNVYLKVKNYDQEWYIDNSISNRMELISFEIDDISSLGDTLGYGFALTYKNEFGLSKGPLTYDTVLVEKPSSSGTDIGSTNGLPIATIKSGDKDFPYVYSTKLIDSVYFYKKVGSESSMYWAPVVFNIKSNSIYRNTFELDPAKQAFQSLNKKDSSRVRWTSGKDIQIISLNNEYITFPHTEEKYSICNYTPRASFENKNVCSDKSKLDKERPNMVNCSFGTDIYKTRCFNWISVGYFPEYIWLKKKISSSWEKRIQSYLPIHSIKITKITRLEGNLNITFDVLTKGFNTTDNIKNFSVLTDKEGKMITKFDMSGIKSMGKTFEISIKDDETGQTLLEGTEYQLHQSIDDFNDGQFPKRKNFDSDLINNIYARMVGRFPADNSFYTSHKVIVDVTDTDVIGKPVEYVYVVGRADKNGNPDKNHISEEYSFTLYPNDYKPMIYQVTDQQGFTWIEYQVWGAVAKKINEKIETDKGIDNSNHIIPILINTGDMTQNGTRVNEWIDYFRCGEILFNHIEQMNVVGNNDLCGPDPNDLGTGDDSGKSNSFYFHLFYCYEVGNIFSDSDFTFKPLLPKINGGEVDVNTKPKCIPSFYFFDTKDYRLLVVNSELTEKTCSLWFNMHDINGNVINAYTGFSLDSKAVTRVYNKNFTTIYTMLYRIMNDAKLKGKKTIAICHEMPFTVITNSSLANTVKDISRSVSKGKLIGSHLNQLNADESEPVLVDGVKKSPKGLYWFSRLLEFFNVELVLGGHKHTYCSTYALRENYKYMANGVLKDSKIDGIMDMNDTLENDSSNFFDNEGGMNLTKFPLVYRNKVEQPSGSSFYPCVTDGFDRIKNKGVVYFMCQASGYKLTSNKELPSSQQKFSYLLPNTAIIDGKDTADDNQKYPMFGIIDITSKSKIEIKLGRVKNIFNTAFKFDQYSFSTSNMEIEWILPNYNEVHNNQDDIKDNYGVWGSIESPFYIIK